MKVEEFCGSSAKGSTDVSCCDIEYSAGTRAIVRTVDTKGGFGTLGSNEGEEACEDMEKRGDKAKGRIVNVTDKKFPFAIVTIFCSSKRRWMLSTKVGVATVWVVVR